MRAVPGSSSGGEEGSVGVPDLSKRLNPAVYIEAEDNPYHGVVAAIVQRLRSLNTKKRSIVFREVFEKEGSSSVDAVTSSNGDADGDVVMGGTGVVRRSGTGAPEPSAATLARAFNREAQNNGSRDPRVNVALQQQSTRGRSGAAANASGAASGKDSMKKVSSTSLNALRDAVTGVNDAQNTEFSVLLGKSKSDEMSGSGASKAKGELGVVVRQRVVCEEAGSSGSVAAAGFADVEKLLANQQSAAEIIAKMRRR